MSILLYRVDERLIHGQVVLGWGSQLRPDRYLVVDDELAGSDWEQDLYRLGAGSAEVEFTTLSEAREHLAEWREAAERSILLTRGIAVMLALAQGGSLEGESVNLGGLHHGAGRAQVLTYLHLTDADKEDLRQLEREGVKVTARDLPDAAKVSLKAMLAS